MNSRFDLRCYNWSCDDENWVLLYAVNSRFDFVTIKDGLWMNSRLGFAEINDGYRTCVRHVDVEIKDGFWTNSRLGNLKKNYGYQMNSRFDIVTIKDRL